MRSWIFGALVPVAVLLVACPPGEVEPQEAFCGVRDELFAKCGACHGPSSLRGGLNLVTNPSASLINAPSTLYPGWMLVVPADPDASLLLAKLEGRLAPDEGVSMPPGGPLPESTVGRIRDWIVAGADTTCSVALDPEAVVRYHPLGWDAPEAHGYAADRLDEDCLQCHGADLTGGPGGAVTCDVCHAGGAAWRTDCVYCHGGDSDTSGAPPRDVMDRSPSSFEPHAAHQDLSRHAVYTCTECHRGVVDVLSPGHLFSGDSTPGAEAEAIFGEGIAPLSVWDGAACSNSYCHGSGRTAGTATVADSYTCSSCHADSTSSEERIGLMSGHHYKHVFVQGLACSECHGPTVTNGQALTGPATHVNGVKDLNLPPTMARVTQGCTGVCHDQTHDNETW